MGSVDRHYGIGYGEGDAGGYGYEGGQGDSIAHENDKELIDGAGWEDGSGYGTGYSVLCSIKGNGMGDGDCVGFGRVDGRGHGYIPGGNEGGERYGLRKR